MYLMAGFVINYILVWIASMCCLMVLAWSGVMGALDRFMDNPTHMVEHSSPLVMKFPSVVVCPSPYFSEEMINRFMNDTVIPYHSNATYVRSIVQQLAAFYAPDVRYCLQDLQALERIMQHNGLSVEEAAFSLTGNCDDIIVRCRLFNRFKNCSDIFIKTFTNMGICCVYNGRSIRREIISKTRGSYGEPQEPPLQVSSSGFSNALMLAVALHKPKAKGDMNYTRVSVQSSRWYAEVSTNGTPLQPHSELWIGYRHHRVLIGLEAQKLGDGLLGCRMSYEQLRFFPVYSQRYCLAECTMANIWKRCGCAGLYYPLAPRWQHCQARDLHCLQSATKEPVTAEDCGCLKSCEQSPSEHLMQSFRLVQDAPALDRFYRGLDYNEVSVVRVFTLHRNTRTKHRRSYYDSINFFSQLGGIFNVYLGCSVLTTLELLQLMWHYVNTWRNRRSQSKIMVKPKEVLKKKAQKNKIQNKQRNKTKEMRGLKEGPLRRY